MAMEIKVVFEETAKEMAFGFENLQIIDASEGSLVPEGTLTITENGTYDVAQFANANVDVPVPDGYLKPDGTLVATQEGVYDVAQYASADFSVQKQQASIIPTQETQTITPSEKAFFDKVVVEAIPSEYLVPNGVLAIDRNGEYDVASYAQAVVNTPDLSGVPIEVTELPTPTVDDIGKVYKVGNDYYVGEESKVGWAQYENLGNKIYFDTSINLTEIAKEYAPINEPVMFFRISDASGLSQEDFLILTIMDLSMMGMSGHIYLLTSPVITDAYVYVDCDTLTVEQFNEIFGQMGMPTSFVKFGWQMDELDTSEWASRKVHQVGGVYEEEINGELVDFFYGENFAYKSKTLTFKNLDNPPILQEKTVTENGVVTPDDGYDGLSKVTVEVASTGGGDAQATLNALLEGNLTEIESDVVTVRAYAFNTSTQLTTVNCPNATSISGNAFGSCNKLTTVNLPNATSVGTNAFNYCPALTTVNCPNATSISGNMFRSCTKLPYANFPNATSVAANAFDSCYSLTKVIVGTNLTTVATLANTTAFNKCYHILGTTDSTYNPNGLKDGYIYVPDNLVEAYKSATNWSTYADQIKGISELPTEE